MSQEISIRELTLPARKDFIFDELTVTTLLTLRNISKHFGGVRALKRVSFELRAGEVQALVGENGAGKSTLIKVITGAHPPDDGEIEVAGDSIRSLDPATAQ